MKLKYERQWETVDKLVKEREVYVLPISWDEKKRIIEYIFNLDQFVSYYDLWMVFEYTRKELYLNNWENQQRPLLDKMIEVVLFNRA